MATDERAGFFDELTKKWSENTTLFFAKHPDERRSSQQLSAFSIALLFHAAWHTREQIHFYLDNIIYLSYPETDADRTTGERILLVNPNKYYKTIDEIPDEKQRAMVYLTKAREQKYNSQTSADIQKKQLDTKNIWDSDKKFKYGVEYRVRELPRCIFLRDGSRKQKKKNTPQKK